MSYEINQQLGTTEQPATKPEPTGLIIPLKAFVLGFDKQPLKFQDLNGVIKDMTIQDILQFSLSNLPADQESKNLKYLYRLIPKLDDDKTELNLLDPEEKKFITDAVLKCKALNPMPKSIVLSYFGEY